MAKVKQYTFLLAHRPGATAAIAKVLAGAKVNILALTGIGHEQQGRIQLVVDNPVKAKKALNAARISYSETTVEKIELPNKPGMLAAHLGKLAAKGVNLSSIYATTSKASKKSTIIYSAEAAPLGH